MALNVEAVGNVNDTIIILCIVMVIDITSARL